MKTLAADLGAIFIGIGDARLVEAAFITRIDMRIIRTLGIAGALVLSALVGGTLIGSALAVDKTTDTEPTAAAGEYCDVFMDSLASELGTTRDELAAAGKTAATAAVDAARAAGDLTEEQATAARERIDAADGTGCAWFGHGFARGFAHGMARGLMGGGVFDAAADALGIDSSALGPQLRDAGSLEALATDQGVAYVDVKTAVLAAVQADLDAKVADGRDQARADAMMERLTTWLDGGGQVDAFGPGRGGFGPGHHGDQGTHDTDAEGTGA